VKKKILNIQSVFPFYLQTFFLILRIIQRDVIKLRPVAAELFHAGGLTDVTKPAVAFRNFAKAPVKTASLTVTATRSSTVAERQCRANGNTGHILYGNETSSDSLGAQ
jgi:hypothetical protein